MYAHSLNQLLNQRLSKLQTQFMLIDHGLCPDWTRKEHIRRRDSIYLILDGEGKITINGKAFYPKKNDMVLLPKGSKVSLYSENETCYNKYWCDFIMKLDDRPFFDLIEFPYIIHLDDITYAKSLFDRLETLHRQTDIYSAMMIRSTLSEIVSMFLRSDVKNIKQNYFAEKVQEFIELNITEPMSVKTLAETMGYNEKYFIKLFKKHFATTPAQYIKVMRLEKAKHELLYTDARALQIIDKIGYSTVQKFSKDFKEYTKLTPNEFRKKFK